MGRAQLVGAGSGLDGTVNALAVAGNDLYAGGTFTTAGGKISPYLAKALLDVPVPPVIFSTNSTIGFSNGQFGFSFSGLAGSSVVI